MVVTADALFLQGAGDPPPRQDIAPALSPPLIVKLEGTLVPTDLVHELILQILGMKPWLLFLMPFWLLQGREAFQLRLTGLATLAPAALPYHEKLLDWLRAQHAAGRKLVLATETDESLAWAVARHLGIFDAVINISRSKCASPLDQVNVMRGAADGGAFDFAGHDAADQAIWSEATTPVVVSASPQLALQVTNRWPQALVFSASPCNAQAWLRSLRVHQWAKNLIVLAPVVTSHQVTKIPVLLAALACMAAFSLTASALYLINDLYDLADDRQHARKCHRPLASGRIPVLRGLFAIPLLLAGAAMCMIPLPASAFGVVVVYFCLTLAYSAFLKRLVLIDVICLAALYIIRIIAGHEAAGLAYSPWLLAFAMFLFFSLALVKRYSELKDARRIGRAKLGGRDYHAGDLEIVAMLGVGSGLIAVLVMALYINSSAVQRLYVSPNLLLPICPLVLYWISRVWLLAHRGVMHEDPVIFALRDPASYAVGLLCGAVMVAASLYH